jgi:DNA-binding SARP family transcriptional activator
VPQLAEQTGEHPGDERAWELLIIALYRCDWRADALSIFQRARTQLADVYGLDPGLGLVGLQRRILADDPALSMS